MVNHSADMADISALKGTAGIGVQLYV